MALPLMRWSISVDDDCNPITGIAHLMKLDPYPADEVESRRPVCGQSFALGWIQIEAAGHEPFCKKCLKIDQTE